MSKWETIKTEYSETKQNKLELQHSENGQFSVRLFSTDENGDYILRRSWTSLNYWSVMSTYGILKRNFIDYNEFVR